MTSDEFLQRCEKLTLVFLGMLEGQSKVDERIYYSAENYIFKLTLDYDPRRNDEYERRKRREVKASKVHAVRAVMDVTGPGLQKYYGQHCAPLMKPGFVDTSKMMTLPEAVHEASLDMLNADDMLVVRDLLLAMLSQIKPVGNSRSQEK